MKKLTVNKLLIMMTCVLLCIAFGGVNSYAQELGNCDDAKAVELNEEFVPSQDDSAYYVKFTVPADGAYRLSGIDTVKDTTASKATVMDKNQAAIKGQSGQFRHNMVERQYLPFVKCEKGEILYAVIENEYEAKTLTHMKYRFEADEDNRNWASRNNDSKDTADTMVLDEGAWGYIDGTGHGNNEDWWIIKIEKAGTYQLSASEGAYKSILLLDKDSKILYDNNLNEKFEKTVKLNADTYYIHVAKQVGGAGLYKLLMTYKPSDVLQKFTDIPEGRWYSKENGPIAYVVENKIMDGTGDGTTFGPEDSCTRSQFVQIIYNAEDKPSVSAANPFSDVPNGKWFTNAVVWAVSNKITGGTSTTTFAPDEEVSREMVAQFLMNYANYRGFSVARRADLSSYPDSAEISGWAYNAVSWANANGIISGYTNGKLGPKDPCTRAQIAQMFMKFRELFGR